MASKRCTTRVEEQCSFDCINTWQQIGDVFGTVAILAQGTHWAVAVMQAFLFEPLGLHFRYELK